MPQIVFSVTYLLIVAAAGLVNGVELAWSQAALTAVVAFFAHQIAEAGFIRIANIAALLSWMTGAVAGLSLLI